VRSGGVRWQYYVLRNEHKLVSLKSRNIVSLVVITGIILLVLYDVTFVLNFGGTRAVETPDPALEIQYERCYQEKDAALHAEAFGTIDNPDVQREVISAGRQRIARECRADYPQRPIRVEQQSEFNLIDLDPRFW